MQSPQSNKKRSCTSHADRPHKQHLQHAFQFSALHCIPFLCSASAYCPSVHAHKQQGVIHRIAERQLIANVRQAVNGNQSASSMKQMKLYDHV